MIETKWILKRIRRLSKTEVIKGNVILVAFVALVLLGTCLLLFLPGTSLNANASGCYPSNNVGFFDCSDSASGGSDVLSESSATPDGCSLYSFSTICPASSGSFVTNAADFTSQMKTDATDFCNNIGSYTGINEQNGVGALYIILTMEKITPSKDSYCPGTYPGGLTLAQIETNWTNSINSLQSSGLIKWDYCPRDPSNTTHPNVDDCGYPITVNTFDAVGGDSNRDDIFHYAGAGSGSVPAIAFYNSGSSTPFYIVKYKCGNPVDNIGSVLASNTTIFGLVYFRVPTASNPNPNNFNYTLPGVGIKRTDCSGDSFPDLYTGGAYKSPVNPQLSQSDLVNYSFNITEGDVFCLIPDNVYYPDIGNQGAVIWSDPIIQPNFGGASMSGNCAGQPNNEYVNQIVGANNSDTAASACKYGMGNNNGYDVVYKQYYENITQDSCSGTTITIAGNSDFTNSTGEPASLMLDEAGGSNSPVTINNFGFSTTYTGAAGHTYQFTLIGTVGGAYLPLSFDVECAPSVPPTYPFIVNFGGDMEAGVDYNSNITGCSAENYNAAISGDALDSSGAIYSALASGQATNFSAGWFNSGSPTPDPLNTDNVSVTNINGQHETLYYGGFFGNDLIPETGTHNPPYAYLDYEYNHGTSSLTYPMCVPDYYSSAMQQTSDQPVSPGPFQIVSGSYYDLLTCITGGNCGATDKATYGLPNPNPLSFAVWGFNPALSTQALYIPPNSCVPYGTHTIIVDNSAASIYIGGNLTYGCTGDPSGYTSVSSIPTFEIIMGPNSTGNIYVDSSATTIEGTFVDEGSGSTLYTCATAPNFPVVDSSLLSQNNQSGVNIIPSCHNTLHIYGSISAHNIDFDRTLGYTWFSGGPCSGTCTSGYGNPAEYETFTPEDWLPYTQLPSQGNSLTLTDYTKLPPKL